MIDSEIGLSQKLFLFSFYCNANSFQMYINFALRWEWYMSSLLPTTKLIAIKKLFKEISLKHLINCDMRNLGQEFKLKL